MFHPFSLRTVYSWILSALLCACLPSQSWSSPSYQTCAEDGGTADCTDPPQGPQVWILPGTNPPVVGSYPSIDAATDAIRAWGFVLLHLYRTPQSGHRTDDGRRVEWRRVYVYDQLARYHGCRYVFQQSTGALFRITRREWGRSLELSTVMVEQRISVRRDS